MSPAKWTLLSAIKVIVDHQNIDNTQKMMSQTKGISQAAPHDPICYKYLMKLGQYLTDNDFIAPVSFLFSLDA